jgi:peptidoglycan biosynthesis protein MviN/MurJ (putative lipid II flippase)
MSIIELTGPVGIFSRLSKFTPQTLNANILVLYFSIPLVLLLTINSFFSDIFISYKYFSVSVVPALLNSILSILFVVIFHNQLQILSILIGVLSANIFQLIFNIYLLKKNMHWSFRFTFIKLPRKTISDIVAAQAGNFSSMLSGYIPLMLLSSFPVGILSSINYSTRVPDLITMLIIVQFGAVTGIKFNELFAQKRQDEIKKAFVEASSLLQFLLIPTCVLVFIFSRDIISLLFGRGAFNATSILNATQFLKLFILILPFTAHNTIVARLFMAAQKVKKSYIYQIIMSLLMTLVIYLSILIEGPKGYPTGVFVFYVLNSFAAIVIMKKNFSFIPFEKTLLYTIKCLLLNAPLAMVIIVEKNVITRHSYVLIASSCIVYCVLLLFLNQKMKINPTIMNIVENVLNRLKVLI